MRLPNKIKSKLILASCLSAFLAFSAGLVIYYGLWTKPTAQFKYFPFESPVDFQQNEQNNGKRCQAVYYGLGNGDGVHNPFCYNLQAQLTQAASSGDVGKIKMLLRNGANADARTDFYYALDAAVANGQTEAARILLDNGAEINHRDTFGGTPLTKAISSERPETVELLLSRGANINLGSEGETAIRFARRRNNQEIIYLLQRAGAQ